MREREPILFIVNPVSGRGNGSRTKSEIEKTLRTTRYSPTVEFTDSPGSATSIAKEYITKGQRKIFAVGGDGTVNEVARSVMGTEATLGIIPIGSGNGLARHLRIPLDISKATKLLFRDRIAMLDCGMVNDLPFFCTSGMGFEASTGRAFDLLKRRGLTSYLRATISEYIKYKPQHYVLRDQGHTISKEAFTISVANASQFGYNAYIAPDADPTDGLLDVTIISPFPKFATPELGLRLFNKTIGKSRYVEMFRVRNLLVECEHDDQIHIDGIATTQSKNLSYKVKSLCLKVYIP